MQTNILKKVTSIEMRQEEILEPSLRLIKLEVGSTIAIKDWGYSLIHIWITRVHSIFKMLMLLNLIPKDSFITNLAAWILEEKLLQIITKTNTTQGFICHLTKSIKSTQIKEELASGLKIILTTIFFLHLK